MVDSRGVITTQGSQAIGHSSNAPCPNLKKLTVPASTTAMMTDLLPWRRAMNGLILTVVGPDVGGKEYNEKYDNNLTLTLQVWASVSYAHLGSTIVNQLSWSIRAWGKRANNSLDDHD